MRWECPIILKMKILTWPSKLVVRSFTQAWVIWQEVLFTANVGSYYCTFSIIKLVDLHCLNIIHLIDIMKVGKPHQRIDTLQQREHTRQTKDGMNVKMGMKLLIATLMVALSTCILAIKIVYSLPTFLKSFNMLIHLAFLFSQDL